MEPTDIPIPIRQDTDFRIDQENVIKYLAKSSSRAGVVFE